MKEELIIAWRNLWRNKRRTLITSASVFFAVFFAVFMRSYQLGSYDLMINNFIESFTGYLQVQHVNYHDNPVIDNTFELNDSLLAAIEGLDPVVSVTPHLESFSLASSGTQTRGVAIIAIDPENEKRFSDPENKLVRHRISAAALQQLQQYAIPEKVMEKLRKNLNRSYTSPERIERELGLKTAERDTLLPLILKATAVPHGYLTAGDKGVLVSDRLAVYLKVDIGDSVILMGQGYHGVSASGIFPVRGIIKMPSPEIDNKLIIMTLTTAQQYFDAGGKISSLVINLTGKSPRTMKTAKEAVNALLNNQETTARTWYELNPILYQQIQGDSQSGIAMLALLYFIIFFGIFGTVLMMVSERKREFGVLVAIGMQKTKLKRTVSVEMLFLGIMGLIAGLLAATPLILYFHYNPITLTGNLANTMEDWGMEAVMPTAPVGSYFYWQALVVVIMVLMATLYPLRKIEKLKVIEALRG